MFKHGSAHSCNKKEDSHNCHHNLTNPSVHQTLDELDFERGIWSSSLAGDFDDVLRKLKSTNGSIVNDQDKSGFSALVS